MLIFTMSFILVTIIGTLTHELGHLVPAKILGYETTLHYGSMSWDDRCMDLSNALFRKYGSKDNVPDQVLNQLDALKEKSKKDTLWITLGGPIQTMSTGLLGFFILYSRRNKMSKTALSLFEWTAVFLSLFWSRQLFNLFMGFAGGLFFSKPYFFGGDEAKISSILGFPIGTVGILTAIIAFVICVYVVLNVVPKMIRYQFIISGILGSAIGFVLWFFALGPMLLP